MKALLIIPVKDAYSTILENIKGIELSVPEIDILVIDYGSKDRTKYLLKNNNIEHLEFFVGTDRRTALNSGFMYAVENGYDCAVEWRQELIYDPNDIEYALRTFDNKKVDLVLGSRYIESKPRRTSYSTRWLRMITKLVSGKKVTDPRLNLRLYSNEVMKKFISTKYFNPGVENVAHILRADYSYAEIQINKNFIKTKHLPNDKGIINTMVVTLLMLFTKPFKKKGSTNVK